MTFTVDDHEVTVARHRLSNWYKCVRCATYGKSVKTFRERPCIGGS